MKDLFYTEVIITFGRPTTRAGVGTAVRGAEAAGTEAGGAKGGEAGAEQTA